MLRPLTPETDRWQWFREEVERRFGVPSNFFYTPPDNPEIPATLWGFATFAYLDNPLPSLFKERLFVYLSRFCDVPYCISRHFGFLVGLGRPSGDPTSPAEAVPEAVRLIRRPLARGAHLNPLLERLTEEGLLADLPEPGTPTEEAVFACASHVFLRTPQAGQCLEVLRHILGETRFQYLLVFLAFVRTAHFWSQVQTDLRLEDDVEHFLASKADVKSILMDDGEARPRELRQGFEDELTALRTQVIRGEQQRRDDERALNLTRTELVERVAELNAARRAALNVMEDAIQARDALREGQERLKLALGVARMGIWRWEQGTDRHYRDANLNRLFGLPAEETVGTLADFLACIHPADRERVAAGFKESIQQGHNLSLEFRVIWPDGTIHWIRDQGDVLVDPQGKYLAGACVDVTDLKEAEAALRDARDRLEVRVAERTAELEEEAERRAELSRRLSTAQEDERRRVSRELHDSVGQLLAGLSLSFKGIETSEKLPPTTVRKLNEAQRLADALGREVHALAVRLRPTSLDDLGLEAALSQLVAEWSDQTGIRADFVASGLGPARLPSEVETALYRVVQEALTNVARHARATSVSVVASRTEGSASALIEDNGDGFDPEVVLTGRLGMLGMRERATLLGGNLEIESTPGAGTTVLIRIPLSEGAKQ